MKEKKIGINDGGETSKMSRKMSDEVSDKMPDKIQNEQKEQEQKGEIEQVQIQRQMQKREQEQTQRQMQKREQEQTQRRVQQREQKQLQQGEQWQEQSQGIEKKIRKINTKKIIILIAMSIILIILATIGILYTSNKEVREVLDKYVLMKNVTQLNLDTIEIDENASNYIYAYDKYIAVLNNGKLTHYSNTGKEEAVVTLEIATPLVDVNNRYLLIADKNSQKIYLISGENIIWEKELEGEISRISVNKNGYVAVVLAGTSYRSVIQVFDMSGKDLFKMYLGTTIAMDIDISQDNKYVSFAEISTTGTLIQSRVKTISVEKAKENEKEKALEAITYTYTAPIESLITNIKYDERNRLVCMYANESIHVIKDEKDEEITKLKENNKKISFGGIQINQKVYRIIEETSLLKTTNSIEIIGIDNKSTSTYTIDGNGTIRDVNSHGNTIAINLGSEVHFIGINGWLIKKYTSTQEIKDIVIADKFAGIVYRNKIEIINL